MEQLKVKIIGTAPYLQNKFVEEEKKKRGKARVSETKEAERKVYKNDEGYFVPCIQIKSAMVKAGTDFQIKGKKTYKEYIKSGIFIEPIEIPLKSKYELYTIPTGLKNGNMILTTRPMWKEWEIEFTLNIMDEMLQKEIILEILEAAGKYKGLGSNRPEFGRFKVEKL